MNTDATRAHVDAETMAAWADRALPAEEAAGVELHLSNCDRCQEVLAAFVRSAPMTGAVVIPFWARRPVQWSAAGLAAAAALVAMVWIGRPPAPPAVETTLASRGVAESPVAVDRLQDKPAAAPAEFKKETPSSLSARQERRRDQPARPLDDKAAANQAAAKATEGRAAAPVASAPLPPPAPAAPPPQPAPAATMPPPITVGAVAAPPVTVTDATTRVPPRPAALSEAVAMDAFSAIVTTFEVAAPDPNSLASRSAAGAGGRGGAVGAKALTQSAGPTRWRVVAGTRIERSVDAGANWTALPIEPELKTPLLAGSATSSLNCWLVGRDGVVLVTYDGRSFRRVSVPEAVHLTAVTAGDGLRATVTAIDGRKFSTIDGGLTWK